MALYKLYSSLNKEATTWWWPNQERPEHAVEWKTIPDLVVFDLLLFINDIRYTTATAHLKVTLTVKNYLLH